MNNIKQTIFSCRGIKKFFIQGQDFIKVLNGIDIDILLGEQVAIVGKSGSGKSTLLHLLGGLDTANSGSINFQGKDITQLSETARGKLRNAFLGFIYQFHHLLPEFSALENVAMPLIIRRMKYIKAKAYAQHILKQVGMINRITHIPSKLSGGERQRVAIARALVTRPTCVLADEPTGNLDHTSANQIFTLMLELSETLGTTFVIVTHDIGLARRCKRVLNLSENGLLPYKLDFV